MKKYFSLLMLVLALLGCSAKNNVKDEISQPTESNNGIRTFVKKVDNVEKSTGRSSKAISIDERVKDFYDNYFNPLISKINNELGRSNIENDAYFKFDKAGNILELGLKTNLDSSSWAQIYKFKPTENNIPVFMYDWNEIMKQYVESYEWAGVSTDTDIPSKKYYSYGGSNQKSSFAIDESGYKEINMSSSSDDKGLILDSTGKVIGATLGSSPSIPIYQNNGFFNLGSVVSNDNQYIDFSKQEGSTWIPIYNNLKVEFNYNNNRVEVYNGETYLGYAENTTFSWTGNEFKIERNTSYATVKYNLKRQITSYRLVDGYSKEGDFEYDSKYGIISKGIETINGTEIENYKIEYNDGSNSNGLFNGFKMTETYRNYNGNRDSDTGKIVYTFEEPDTTIVEIKYYRNSSTGDITEVYSNINLGENAKIVGTYVPKI